MRQQSPPFIISDFRSLFKTCLKPNICQFGDSIYKLPPDIGIPIGSLLGSLISEVFMSSLEVKIFQLGHPLLPCISMGRRYLDDVLCVWTGSEEQLGDFLTHLNSFYPSIIFTMEIGGQRIDFLDLIISILSDRYTFEIYRKDTATDILIHGSSFCPSSHKVAAFNSYIHRLVPLPLHIDAYNKEVSILKHLAIANSIKIDGLIRRKTIRIALRQISNLPPPLKW